MNQTQRRASALRWSIVIIFLLACFGAVLFLELKSQALMYHTRDFPFYLQFAAKLLDPELPRRFTINPDGFNYLGYVGSEGARSFHQSLHLEPIRYLSAAAYALTGSPVSLYMFYAILYFLPLLYLAFVYPAKNPPDRWFFLLLSLLYVLFPLTLSAIADDLRPRTLMVPAFVLCFLAVHWRRNWVEKLAFFGLLLITREEALILAAGLILYDFFRARSLKQNNKMVFLFAGLWLAWLSLQFLYFEWAGYPISQDLTPYFALQGVLGRWPWLLAAAVGLAVLIYFFRSQIKIIWKHPAAPAMVSFVLLILTPLMYQCIREEAHWFQSASFVTGSISVINDLIFFSKNVLLFAAGLMLLVQIWDHICQERARRVILFAAGAVLIVSSMFGIQAAVKKVGEFQQVIPQARVLADLRQITDNRSSAVLTDYATNQAFYDYDQQYVYERLPSYMLQGEDRFYPKNVSVLTKLAQDKLEYAAVSAENKGEILQLLGEAGVKPQIVAENQLYVVMRLR